MVLPQPLKMRIHFLISGRKSTMTACCFFSENLQGVEECEMWVFITLKALGSPVKINSMCQPALGPPKWYWMRPHPTKSTQKIQQVVLKLRPLMAHYDTQCQHSPPESPFSQRSTRQLVAKPSKEGLALNHNVPLRLFNDPVPQHTLGFYLAISEISI